MTYCLGILLPSGLVMASDSRSNAGIDQINLVRKMAHFGQPGRCTFVILSAGNLGTTQAVVTTLRQAAGTGDPGSDLFSARTMFDAATMLGNKLREVIARDGRFVEPYGDPNGSFLLGGQIAGEAPRLFQIYSAGNFIEASNRSCFLQIGETKYGKPILDRAISTGTSLDEAAKLAMLSFDATMRSNLSVGMPIDMLRYRADSFTTDDLAVLEQETPYWRQLRQSYASGLAALIEQLPVPPPMMG